MNRSFSFLYELSMQNQLFQHTLEYYQINISFYFTYIQYVCYCDNRNYKGDYL